MGPAWRGLCHKEWRMVKRQRWLCNLYASNIAILKASRIDGKITAERLYDINHAHLSSAIATKCKMDAVQHRTSQDVHISHSSGPRIQPLLIYMENERFKE